MLEPIPHASHCAGYGRGRVELPARTPCALASSQIVDARIRPLGVLRGAPAVVLVDRVASLVFGPGGGSGRPRLDHRHPRKDQSVGEMTQEVHIVDEAFRGTIEVGTNALERLP